MIKLRVLLFAIAVLAMGGILASLNGCGGSSGETPPSTVVTEIQHVVVIFQENRTTDNLFQDRTDQQRRRHRPTRNRLQWQSDRLKEVACRGLNPDHGHVLLHAMCHLNSAGQCQMAGRSWFPSRAMRAPTALRPTFVRLCGPRECSTILCAGGAIHIRRPHVPDQPGAELSGTSVHHFRNIGSIGRKQPVCGRNHKPAEHQAQDATRP